MIRRVFEQGAYADRALHSAVAGLDGRDRALAMMLAYGTVQRKRTLDYLLADYSSRPLAKLDPAILAALRLGLFQMLYLGGVADYAAVNESVELAKRSSKGGAQLVNAVLRRAGREAPARLAALDDKTAIRAAVLNSVPDWLSEMWWRELGPDQARALMMSVNLPAESAIRVNTLKATREQVQAALPPETEPHPAPPWSAQPGLPELSDVLVLGGAFDAFGSDLFIDGSLMPQSRGSAVVAAVLAPQPGERVLDLCAAPGGKTTQLAALMGGEGEVVAVELHPGRARALAETCRQMGAQNVTVRELDARQLDETQTFDRVLVDPPCSGLGTVQARADLRWQPRREQIGDLAARQQELLRSGAAALRSGGTLVYSVCTISQAEGESVIDAFLSAQPEFSRDAQWQLLPSVDGTDGFYIASLRRA